MTLTYVSLFAGAGGFDLGFDVAGFRCLAQVEIDKTCRAVLARHWPDVPRYEDVRAFGSAQVPHADVVVGGFPCQDVSVAGKRGGFEAGVRSSLWFEMVRVIRELRPLSVVWENVPGLLSADEGRAFGWVLRELADLGFNGAWGDFDARFFGVPQSRQRVFGVFFNGHPGARGAGEVLALAPGLRRHPAAGGETGPGTATSVGSRAAAAGGAACFGGNDTRGERGVAAALSAKGGTGRIDFESETFVVFNPQAAGKQTTLGTRDDGLTGALGTGQVPAVAYQCHGSNVGPAATQRCGGTVEGGVPFQTAEFSAGQWVGEGGLAEVLRRLRIQAAEGTVLNDDHLDALVCSLTGVVPRECVLRGQELEAKVRERLEQKVRAADRAKLVTTLPAGYVLVGKLPDLPIHVSLEDQPPVDGRAK